MCLSEDDAINQRNPGGPIKSLLISTYAGDRSPGYVTLRIRLGAHAFIAPTGILLVLCEWCMGGYHQRTAPSESKCEEMCEENVSLGPVSMIWLTTITTSSQAKFVNESDRELNCFQKVVFMEVYDLPSPCGAESRFSGLGLRVRSAIGGWCFFSVIQSCLQFHPYVLKTRFWVNIVTNTLLHCQSPCCIE